MATKTKLTATDEILEVLRAAKVAEDGIELQGQLDPASYKKVDKFLKESGVLWNRGKRRHLFESPEARAKFLGLVETGEVRRDKVHFQAYDTPAEVASGLADLLGLCGGMKCLEPSAGRGRLAEALRNSGGDVACMDIDPAAIEALKALGFPAIQGDFLEMTAARLSQVHGHGPFDRILMNPPFANCQDIRHVRHAFSFLKPGGQLLAVVSAGALANRRGTERDFQSFVAKNGGVEGDFESGTFAESGTGVRTSVIRLVRPS